MNTLVLSQLSDNLPFYIYWKDTELNYIGCNQQFAIFAGCNRPEEIIGRTDFDLYWSEERAKVFRNGDQQVIESKRPILNIEHTLIGFDGDEQVILCSTFPLYDERNSITGVLGYFSDITSEVRRKEQLILQKNILDNIANGVLVTNPDGVIQWANLAISNITGYTRQELLGARSTILSGQPDSPTNAQIWSYINQGKVWHGELINRKKDGSLYTEEMTITPIKGNDGETAALIAVKMDISEKKELEYRLTQVHRLESIGQLAAGIAHEINTPAQYVGDNTEFLQSSLIDFMEIIHKYDLILEELAPYVSQEKYREKIQIINDIKEKIDFDFLLDEVPNALSASIDGISRIKTIVRSMKEFSHPGSQSYEPLDIPHAIETTVSVARNEWKYDATIELELDNDPLLKEVPCLIGEFKQALLNILVNAAHAIKEKREKEKLKEKGVIRIAASCSDGMVEVQIADTGTGIPAEIIPRIFDPFYTTKKVGKGTGQGLNIAYYGIVKKQGGTITCESQEGVGTTFSIRLPLRVEEKLPA